MYYIEGKEIFLINPINLGLSSRALLGQLSEKHIVIIKDRKSRIIMKDGNQILKQINLIQSTEPKLKISLATNAPICSKTTVFLKERGIEILSLEKSK